jgi:hypothetical protein
MYLDTRDLKRFLTYLLILEMQNCLTLESSGAAIAEGGTSP